jgi:hypothetical protein
VTLNRAADVAALQRLVDRYERELVSLREAGQGDYLGARWYEREIPRLREMIEERKRRPDPEALDMRQQHDELLATAAAADPALR